MKDQLTNNGDEVIRVGEETNKGGCDYQCHLIL